MEIDGFCFPKFIDMVIIMSMVGFSHANIRKLGSILAAIAVYVLRFSVRCSSCFYFILLYFIVLYFIITNTFGDK